MDQKNDEENRHQDHHDNHICTCFSVGVKGLLIVLLEYPHSD